VLGVFGFFSLTHSQQKNFIQQNQPLSC
jgi:hypothetical protein